MLKQSNRKIGLLRYLIWQISFMKWPIWVISLICYNDQTTLDKLFDHVDFVKAMLDFFLQPCDTVTFVFTLYDVKQRLKWPGMSVLTVITVEAVLPAIAEIAIVAATLTSALIVFCIEWL